MSVGGGVRSVGARAREMEGADVVAEEKGVAPAAELRARFAAFPPPAPPPPPASGGDTVVDTGRARKTPREPAPNGDVSAVSPIPPPISILPARRRSAGCLERAKTAAQPKRECASLRTSVVGRRRDSAAVQNCAGVASSAKMSESRASRRGARHLTARPAASAVTAGRSAAAAALTLDHEPFFRENLEKWGGGEMGGRFRGVRIDSPHFSLARKNDLHELLESPRSGRQKERGESGQGCSTKSPKMGERCDSALAGGHPAKRTGKKSSDSTPPPPRPDPLPPRRAFAERPRINERDKRGSLHWSSI